MCVIATRARAGFDEQNEFAAKTGHVPLKITKDNKASVRDGRLDVGVYLGGCGDVRHGYCTMVDVAQRAPALNKVLLRLDLNDHMPEVRRFAPCMRVQHISLRFAPCMHMRARRDLRLQHIALWRLAPHLQATTCAAPWCPPAMA